METHKTKKDSVFSGILPSNDPPPAPTPMPAPTPVPAPQAHGPAVSAEQLAGINNRIELMERSIVGQLEKRLAERVPPPPPPPSVLAPEAISKMTEMENRLKDFQEKFLLGAAQMKNIEESKISARREIEELLKVVREQQKYSELDRQMHDQLEKAWARVEEMEKRLLEVYSAAAKKPAETPFPAVTPEKIAEAVLKAVDARLEQRLAPLEAMLKDAAARIETVPAASRGVEASVASLSASVDGILAGFSSEIRKLQAEAFAGKDRVEDIVSEVKDEISSAVKEAFAEGSVDFVRHVDAAAMDGRERADALGKLVVGHMDELAARDRENAAKADMFEAYVRSEAGKAASALPAMQRGIEEALRAHIDAGAAKAAEENRLQLERIREVYGLSASNNSAVAAAKENISEIEAKLGETLAGLKAFIKALEPVNLTAMLGVSGAIVRRSFESVGALVSGLEKDAVRLARAKGEIEANMKSLASRPCGEEK